MKRAFKISFALVAALVLLGESAATAQMGRGRGPGSRMYDPATEVTMHGTIDRVQRDAKPFRNDAGVNRRYRRDAHLVLTLRTRTGLYTVMVGPTSFVADRRFRFAKGDRIEVTGSRLHHGDGDSVLARKIRKRGRTLILRDDRGIAEWSMGRGR
jgi:hypothetical protein